MVGHILYHSDEGLFAAQKLLGRENLGLKCQLITYSFSLEIFLICPKFIFSLHLLYNSICNLSKEEFIFSPFSQMPFTLPFFPLFPHSPSDNFSRRKHQKYFLRVPRTFLDFIDEKKNCEDIAMAHTIAREVGRRTRPIFIFLTSGL